MTKETETLAVLQNESFNFPRYYDGYLMDPWRQYSDSPLQVENCSKSRLTCDEDVTAFSFLCDQYKTLKDQKIMPCNRSSSVYKPPERNPSLTSPELSVLESPTNIMKLLSDTISSAQQEAPDLNKRPPTLCTPRTPAQPDDFIEPSSEIYDKQVINHIFESILLPSQSKWNTSTSPEAVHYTEPFVEQTSPAYSYTNSPPPSYRNEFQFVLGAPQAIQHKPSNIPMVYLNKGQFYPITLNSIGDGMLSHSRSKVKVVVMAVFENEKSPELQLKCWNHWHARQPTVKQRVIDIADYKEVFSSISHVEEVAFNALSFIWNSTEEAKVYIGINSLSTDFSSQKGVKGLPLNLQIDTYDFSSGTNRLIHRAACQVKIFCDKGAERKMRDEDRKRVKRRTKNADSSLSTSSSKQSVVSSSVCSDSTYFKSVDDLVAQPVLFIPEMHFTMQRCSLVPSVTSEDSDRCSLKRKNCPPYSEGGQQCGPQACKQPRKEESQRVLLYVRTESEEVFDALMLSTPNLKGLKQAISEKYGVQEEAIGKIYKKCKRGIFVNMDDNIIEHYCNHSAFQLEMTDMLGQYQVTLTEL